MNKQTNFFRKMNVHTMFRESSYLIYVLADFRDTVPLRCLLKTGFHGVQILMTLFEGSEINAKIHIHVQSNLVKKCLQSVFLKFLCFSLFSTPFITKSCYNNEIYLVPVILL